MKILVICQYYFPEPFRISDICEELVKRGHDVTVITGIPNYPMGKIYQEYKNGKKRDEFINGVHVYRCFTIGRRTGPVFRFLNYYSYMFSSSRYVSKLKDNFDVVFVNQLSPVMMAKAGIKYKKKYGKKLILYCLDLWPESIIAGGIGRNSLIYRYFHKVSGKIYNQADTILITSHMFSKYFKDEFGMTNKDIVYLPQYAEAMFSPKTCAKKPDGNIDLLFAGNIGTAQSVETILRAAVLLKDNPEIRFHIVGDGSSLADCKRLAQQLELSSVTFYGRKPMEEMPEYYAMADAMLVTLTRDPVLSLTLPGKVQSYLAAGKPVIAAADGETAKIIRLANCGYCSEAENNAALAENILLFSAREGVHTLSEAARSFYEEHMSKGVFIEKLENELTD